MNICKDAKQPKKIDHYIFDKNQMLGSGAYANVYLGWNQVGYGDPDQYYAIKEQVAPRENTDEENQFLKVVVREYTLLKGLDHPNIIRLIDAKKSKDHFYIIMEYCNQQSLLKFLQKKTLSEKEILGYFEQIVEAFRYLHDQKQIIIHRDIKPDNILMHNNKIKIGDFGHARHFEGGTDQTIAVGTYAYNSPQLLRGETYTTLTDIWSLGVTLYQMFYKEIPWTVGCNDKKLSNPYQLAKKIIEVSQIGIPFPSHVNMSEKTKQLITKMLKVDESERMQWDELFKYFKQQPIFQIEHTKRKKIVSTFDESSIRVKDNSINQQELQELVTEKQKQFLILAQMRESSIKVTQRLDYERNICIFLVNIIDRIMNCEIKLGNVYYLVCFLFCKKLYMHQIVLRDMLDYKHNVFNFNQQDWEYFIKCEDPNEYEKNKLEIQNDFQYCEQMYLDFCSTIKKDLNLFNDPLFIEMFNEELLCISQFKNHFEKIQELLLKQLKTEYKQININELDNHQKLLFLLDDLFINITITQSLPWKPEDPINFIKFYEDRRFSTLECIHKRISQAYNEFDI